MKHIAQIKSVPIFKCQHCGSSNLKIYVDGISVDPKNPNVLEITKLLKNKINYCFWECHKCEDEASASMSIDDKIYKNPIDVLKYLSGSKIDINIKKSIEIGDIATLKEYIDAGNSVNNYLRDTTGLTDFELEHYGAETLLCFAVSKTKFNIVEFLVNSGCDINKKSDINDRFDRTPLGYSISELNINSRQRVEKMKILDILLENGADPKKSIERLLYYDENRTKKLASYILEKIKKTSKNL